MKNAHVVSESLVEEETFYTNTQDNNCLEKITASTLKEEFRRELTAWLPKFPVKGSEEDTLGRRYLG